MSEEDWKRAIEVDEQRKREDALLGLGISSPTSTTEEGSELTPVNNAKSIDPADTSQVEIDV